MTLLILGGIKRFMVKFFEMMLILGDWDRVKGLRVGNNQEVLQEWKWNQGTLKHNEINERPREGDCAKELY